MMIKVMPPHILDQRLEGLGTLGLMNPILKASTLKVTLIKRKRITRGKDQIVLMERCQPKRGRG